MIFKVEYSKGIPLYCFNMSFRHSCLTFLCFGLLQRPLYPSEIQKMILLLLLLLLKTLIVHACSCSENLIMSMQVKLGICIGQI